VGCAHGGLQVKYIFKISVGKIDIEFEIQIYRLIGTE
jgi:hypothetical protein